MVHAALGADLPADLLEGLPHLHSEAVLVVSDTLHHDGGSARAVSTKVNFGDALLVLHKLLDPRVNRRARDVVLEGRLDRPFKARVHVLIGPVLAHCDDDLPQVLCGQLHFRGIRWPLFLPDVCLVVPSAHNGAPRAPAGRRPAPRGGGEAQEPRGGEPWCGGRCAGAGVRSGSTAQCAGLGRGCRRSRPPHEQRRRWSRQPCEGRATPGPSTQQGGGGRLCHGR
mmetsp:Transcript_27367/g.82433  ORF Transcript_27367/g.82433 Transcript_27367/m.82433 type:complete len:225 (-) Transcript_27367:54-728(-)